MLTYTAKDAEAVAREIIAALAPREVWIISREIILSRFSGSVAASNFNHLVGQLVAAGFTVFYHSTAPDAYRCLVKVGNAVSWVMLDQALAGEPWSVSVPASPPE